MRCYCINHNVSWTHSSSLHVFKYALTADDWQASPWSGWSVARISLGSSNLQTGSEIKDGIALMSSRDFDPENKAKRHFFLCQAWMKNMLMSSESLPIFSLPILGTMNETLCSMNPTLLAAVPLSAFSPARRFWKWENWFTELFCPCAKDITRFRNQLEGLKFWQFCLLWFSAGNQLTQRCHLYESTAYCVKIYVWRPISFWRHILRVALFTLYICLCFQCFTTHIYLTCIFKKAYRLPDLFVAVFCWHTVKSVNQMIKTEKQLKGERIKENELDLR